MRDRSPAARPGDDPKTVKLAVDENLGRLATWLRVLGLDTVYLKPGTDPDQKAALAQGRIFLGRAGQTLPGHRIAIQAEDPFEQLLETARKLELRFDRLRLFSRCLRCNSPLRPISREAAAGLVPDYVLTTQSHFKSCPGCGRIFWPGTHQARMAGRLERLRSEIS